MLTNILNQAQYLSNKAQLILAQQPAGTSGINPPTGTGADPGGENVQISSLNDIVETVINVVFGVGLALALIFVIVGGIKYVTSQGDQTKAEEARNTITNAVIGAVIIVAFRIILEIVLTILVGEGLGDLLNGNE